MSHTVALWNDQSWLINNQQIIEQVGLFVFSPVSVSENRCIFDIGQI